jgi:8-oxo-dGTP pyrophosphatase MutT (NUDIX family)
VLLVIWYFLPNKSAAACYACEGWLNLRIPDCIGAILSVSLLQLIETRLSRHKPIKKWFKRFRQRSAVAMILKIKAGELHILMIKRAEREGDPWSGHMAFPGGRMDPEDAHGFAVAVRETSEEVGLTLLDEDLCIGRLSEINARHKRGSLGMAVSPFVFKLERDVDLTPNYEVAEVVWVPLEFLMDPDNREQMTWQYKGAEFPMPCYMFQGRRIWGLSLMMLDELLDVIEGRNSPRIPWRRR